MSERIKCPKCQSIRIDFVERADCYFDFEYDVKTGEYFPSELSEISPNGRIEGFCKNCRHNWKLRDRVNVPEYVKQGGLEE